MINWKTEWKKIAELRKNKVSFQKIGKQYGVSRQAVQKGLKMYTNMETK